MKEPQWTTDSHHNDDQKEDIDKFLQECEPAFKYVINILKKRFSNIYNRYVQSNKHFSIQDQEHYEQRPYAPYTTLTINNDIVVTMHKDWNSNIDGMEYIIIIGDWTQNGNLILEDLNAHIVLKPGDIYFLNSANVFHAVTPYSGGSRYSFVMFSDKNMIN